MKGIVLTSIASVVIATAWFGFSGNNTKALESKNVKNNEDVVATALDEDLEDNGTISDGIRNTSMILNASLENTSSFSDVKGVLPAKRGKHTLRQFMEMKSRLFLC